MAKGIGFYNNDFFVIKKDKDLLYESVIRILMTSPTERVKRPNWGVGIYDKVFKIVTPDTLEELAVKIHNALNQDPRLKISNVKTIYDPQEKVIYIHLFLFKSTANMKEDEIIFKWKLPE